VYLTNIFSVMDIIIHILIAMDILFDYFDV